MIEIQLPDIEGISARDFEGDDDYHSIARLINAQNDLLGAIGHVSGPEVKGWLDTADDIDKASDYVFVDLADETIGYVLCATWVEHSGRRIYRHNGRVHPVHRGRGIGTGLIAWARAHQAAKVPELGPGTLQSYVYDGDIYAESILVGLGYSPVGHDFLMVRPHLDDIPDRPLPDGLEIRPVEESHLRPIWEADAEAFKDHWGTSPPTEGDWKSFLDFAHRDESMWRVAWHGDRVVGQVRGYVNKDESEALGIKRGWCEFISTARDWRGRGVASALICETLREFKRRGLEDAALGVHAENPTGALSLYEGLGFAKASGGATYERPLN